MSDLPPRPPRRSFTDVARQFPPIVPPSPSGGPAPEPPDSQPDSAPWDPNGGGPAGPARHARTISVSAQAPEPAPRPDSLLDAPPPALPGPPPVAPTRRGPWFYAGAASLAVVVAAAVGLSVATALHDDAGPAPPAPPALAEPSALPAIPDAPPAASPTTLPPTLPAVTAPPIPLPAAPAARVPEPAAPTASPPRDKARAGPTSEPSPAPPPAPNPSLAAPEPPAVAPDSLIPAASTITVRQRRDSPEADAEAEAIAAALRPGVAEVRLDPVSKPFRHPTVLYFHKDDAVAAQAIVSKLDGLGRGWVARRAERASVKKPPNAFEVWLPSP